MRRVPVLAAALLAAAALAGCASGTETTKQSRDSWSYSASGQGNAQESGELDVPNGAVEASLSVGGQASIQLVVRDDDGDTVMRMECSGQGGCSKSRTADDGEPGTWSVTLEGLYNGGVSASVTAK